MQAKDCYTECVVPTGQDHRLYGCRLNGFSSKIVSPLQIHYFSFRQFCLVSKIVQSINYDFFLWGYLNKRIYETKPRTLDELKDSTRQKMKKSARKCWRGWIHTLRSGLLRVLDRTFTLTSGYSIGLSGFSRVYPDTPCIRKMHYIKNIATFNYSKLKVVWFHFVLNWINCTIL